MSNVSKESKILLFASFVLAFVGVSAVAGPNQSPENLYIAVGASLILLILAAIFFIAGITRLQKEGAISFPAKPLIPAWGAPLPALAGVAASFVIIHYAGLLENVILALWVFLLCAGLGGFSGLYMAGLRISKKS